MPLNPSEGAFLVRRSGRPRISPIWITSFDYNGTVYRVLINGQTGNIVGTWPKSFKRFFMIFGLIVGGIFGTQFLLSLFRMFVAWLQSLGK